MHIQHLVCSKHMASRLSITRHTTNLDTKNSFWLESHIHRRQARKNTNLIKECTWRKQSQTSVVVEEAGTYSKKKSKNLHHGFHVAHLMNSMAISGPLSLRCVLWMQWKKLRKKGSNQLQNDCRGDEELLLQMVGGGFFFLSLFRCLRIFPRNGVSWFLLLLSLRL